MMLEEECSFLSPFQIMGRRIRLHASNLRPKFVVFFFQFPYVINGGYFFCNISLTSVFAIEFFVVFGVGSIIARILFIGRSVVGKSFLLFIFLVCVVEPF